jgi:hypothetical protein
MQYYIYVRKSLPGIIINIVLYNAGDYSRQTLSNINIVLYNTGDYSRQTLSNINIVLYNTGDYSRQTLSGIISCVI